MKTFTATQLNKSAKEVFRAADKDGRVYIEHDRYADKVFVLEARERRGSGLVANIDDVDGVTEEMKENARQEIIGLGLVMAENKDKLWPTDREGKQ